jgi:hypothetical protein
MASKRLGRLAPKRRPTMIRTPIAYALLLASTALSSGCAKNQTASPNAATEAALGVSEHQMMGPGMMGMGMGDQCPMVVPGTSVQAAETSDGMSMTFTTTGDVAALRQRVHAMADHMNGQSSGSMGMQGMRMGGVDGGSGMMGGGMGSGMHGMMGGVDGGSGTMMGGMMPVHVQVEEVEGGARARVTPVDPSRLGEMKQHIQQHVQMMNQAHSCPMMGAGQ